MNSWTDLFPEHTSCCEVGTDGQVPAQTFELYLTELIQRHGEQIVALLLAPPGQYGPEEPCPAPGPLIPEGTLVMGSACWPCAPARCCSRHLARSNSAASVQMGEEVTTQTVLPRGGRHQ